MAVRWMVGALLVCGLVVGRARAEQTMAPGAPPPPVAQAAPIAGAPAGSRPAPSVTAAGEAPPPAADPAAPPRAAAGPHAMGSGSQGAPPSAAPLAMAPNAASPIGPAAVPPLAGASPLAAPDPDALEPDSEATEVARPFRRHDNLIFVELGGNGILYTINYDRAIAAGFTFRVGLGHLAEGANPIASAQTVTASLGAFGIPVLINHVSGSDKHRLELGAGVTFLYTQATQATRYRAATPSGISPLATALVGYRYVPEDGGFTYRVGFTPLISTGGILPWAGVSFGYLF
jgi:hypothetical protein